MTSEATNPVNVEPSRLIRSGTKENDRGGMLVMGGLGIDVNVEAEASAHAKRTPVPAVMIDTIFISVSLIDSLDYTNRRCISTWQGLRCHVDRMVAPCGKTAIPLFTDTLSGIGA